MEQGIFDRLLDGGDRLSLPADLLPRDGRNLVQEVGLGLFIFKFFNRHMEAWLDPHLIACLQVYPEQIARPLEDQDLPAHFLLEPKPPIRQGFRDFQHGAIPVITQNLNDGEGFVDENLRADLELGSLHPGIDAGIVLSAPHQDPGETFARYLKQGADPVGRRDKLRDDVSGFFEFDFSLQLRRLSESHGMAQFVEDLLAWVAVRK